MIVQPCCHTNKPKRDFMVQTFNAHRPLSSLHNQIMENKTLPALCLCQFTKYNSKSAFTLWCDADRLLHTACEVSQNVLVSVHHDTGQSFQFPSNYSLN
ncbi:hypothetical protein GJAV_G00004930 [Gymnothorax javanicus]|nr:hypothetical protein GJAV_G00004930 [Gymnothorax javanicus]